MTASLSPYTSLALHVFSGTGNSLCAAGRLAEQFGRDKTRMTRIGKEGPPEQAPPPGSLITGFLFPTHGFTAPWIVIRHALRLPPVKYGAAFVMAARAGTWPGFLLP